MTPERWRQVTRVYGAVMTKPPDIRAAALLELCPDDESLRKEVESLLKDDSGAALLDHPLGIAATATDQSLSGRTLGPYHLDSAIGAGGMGQVYRASDTRLNRTVAVKVLTPGLAHDPQFRARFDREAKSIAALNHPHICTLFDVGSTDGVDYLVMEYVEGEPLSARLERGPLPLAESLQSAIQIADALSAAHRQGIVHRDLKPANVMLTKSGVKLLDFGLAKASQASAVTGVLSMLPTTPPIGATRAAPLTAQGTILGTFQYMAPEQLEGKEADARADIFACGALVYEMLTGQKAFEGQSQASLIGAIMHADPAPIADRQPLTPPALERAIKTCLAKSPDDRWQTARDLARELRWIADHPQQSIPSAQARGQSKLPWALATLLVATVVALVLVIATHGAPPATPRVSRFAVTGVGPAAVWFGTGDSSIATADGSSFVYIGNNGTQVFLRKLDQVSATPIARGTALRSMFMSVDGKWAGYFDGDVIKRVSIEGGTPLRIGSLSGQTSRGVAWVPDDTLVFASTDNATGLLRIPALTADAEPEILTRPDVAKDEADHVWPSALPDGSGILFTITAQTGGPDSAQVAYLDLKTKSITPLLRHATQARYVNSGHMLYASRGTLFAVPFDLRTHRVTGAAVSVVENVRSAGNGFADYAIAADGTLVFVSGIIGAIGQPRSLTWVDRSGHEQSLGAPERSYVEPRLSPDDTRIAVFCADQDQDIWIWDERRPAGLAPLTHLPTVEQSPVWTRDGKRVIFASDRGPVFGIFNLYMQAADDETQPATRLTNESTNQQFPEFVSADGSQIFFRETPPDGGRRLMRKRIAGADLPQPVFQTSARARNGEVSPNQRWFAFETDSSGTFEVNVRALNGTGQWPVSIGGGTQPHWSSAGKELFYVDAAGALMKVDVSDSAEWKASPPIRLLAPGYYTGTGTGRFEGRQYDVSHDGTRFLMIKAKSDVSPPSVFVVEHFDSELKARVPVK